MFKKLKFHFLIAILFFSSISYAGFDEGVTAYEKGDYLTAYKEFKPLAKQGDVWAQLQIGFLYEYGFGVNKDYKQAVYWYRKAAEQGNQTAQLFLGIIYDVGLDGLTRNANEAIYWYRLAAAQGDVKAQSNLGLMYLNGKGVAKDFVVAYHWFNLAAMSGDDKIIKVRNLLENQLNTDQISQAQAITREFLANKDKPKVESAPEPEKPKKAIQTMTGTAFLVNKTGQLLTNAHVVNQCQKINVYSENTTHTAQLVALDAVNDMAILKTQLWSDAKPISFSKNTISLGQDIYAIGYPLPNVLALDLQMTKGNVSALAGLGNDARFYQISAPVQSGNSGGPLVNAYGLVSGMVTSKANIVKMKELTGDFPQNVNFALKESQLKNYLDTNGIFYLTSSEDDELKGEQIASQARKYTVLVECVK